MMCEKCKKRPAVVHVSINDNGKYSEKNLCRECAAEPVFAVAGGEIPSLFHFAAPKTKKVYGPGGEICPDCHMSYREFVTAGRFGCATCYKVFEPYLRDVYKRIQAGERHVGRKYGKRSAQQRIDQDEASKAELSVLKEQALQPQTKLQELQKQQQAAIVAENYEEAARLRDQIKALGPNDTSGADTIETISDEERGESCE